MNNDKYNYYINKIKDYSMMNGTYKYFISKKTDIEKYLKEIIDNNLDYLLTDSLIAYICNSSLISLDLYCLLDHYSRYSLLIYYFCNISSSLDPTVNPDDNSFLFYRLMDEVSMNQAVEANKLIDHIYEDLDGYHYRLYDLEHIIYIVQAYCYINNKTSEFSTIIKRFMDDPYATLNDLYMNDISSFIGNNIDNDHDNKLVDRIISVIETKKKVL